MSSFTGATLTITGGASSLGSTVLKHFLKSDLKEISIFPVLRKSRKICDIVYSERVATRY